MAQAWASVLPAGRPSGCARTRRCRWVYACRDSRAASLLRDAATAATARTSAGSSSTSTGRPTASPSSPVPALAPGAARMLRRPRRLPRLDRGADGRLLALLHRLESGAAPAAVLRVDRPRRQRRRRRTFERRQPRPGYGPQRLRSVPASRAPCVVGGRQMADVVRVGGSRGTRSAGELALVLPRQVRASPTTVSSGAATAVSCIDHSPQASATSRRPVGSEDGGRYRMWYAAAGERPYRLGYARSRRRAGLDSAWTSDAGHRAVELGLGLAARWPTPGSRAQRRSHVLLYNGNDYGREGFGLAVAAA